MKAVNLFDYLSGNEYPGRGIAVGRTPCGKKMRIAYFIMGRSENSRNRIFVTEGEGIRTEAYDPSKMKDPSLIIYAPVRVFEDTTIVTNGDQTDTIYDFMAEGKSFEDALRTRTYEPDGPNWTPRISAVVKGDSYQMSILKSADGNPIPSFEGEPVLWEMEKMPFDEWSDKVWASLNKDNKVSLFTRAIDIETGETKTRIYNKHEEE